MYNVYVGIVPSSPPVVSESIVEHSHDPDEEHGVGEKIINPAWSAYAVRGTVFIESFICSHSISETACHTVTKRHCSIIKNYVPKSIIIIPIAWKFKILIK